MRRKILGLVVMVFVATQAYGASVFNWVDFSNTVSPPFPVNRTVLTYTSSDTNINFDINNPFLPTYGNDSLFDSAATIVLADSYFTSDMNMPDDSLVGRYAYAVVVDLDFGSYGGPGTIPGGTKFGVSKIAEDSINPGTPWAIYKTDGAIPNPAQNFSGGPIVNLIPEPGSAVLLVVGAAAAFWQRRRSRR